MFGIAGIMEIDTLHTEFFLGRGTALLGVFSKWPIWAIRMEMPIMESACTLTVFAYHDRAIHCFIIIAETTCFNRVFTRSPLEKGLYIKRDSGERWLRGEEFSQSFCVLKPFQM